MEEPRARRYGWAVVGASWLAVFCLFGYRATFAILKGPMEVTLGWSTAQVTLGYSLMMVCYAVTAYLSGFLLDRWGTRPAYAAAALLGSLGFILTSRMGTLFAYLLTFGLLGGLATGLLWVSSTVSVRQWYRGNTYGTMWGIAFSGAPLAQFVLAQLVKPRLGAAQQALDRAVIVAAELEAVALPPAELAQRLSAALADPAVRSTPDVAVALEALDVAWRGEMLLLGFIVLGTLALASLLGRRAPEAYGLKPHGLSGAGCEGTSSSEWSVRGAFSRYAIWGAILTFLTSMMAEFLIWTQVIGYWTEDVGYSLEAATGIYAVVGLIGIVSMPLMGKVADLAVQRLGREVGGRRLMLLLGPGMGMAACLLLLFSAQPVLAYAAAFVFALYWAIVPGGVVGYVGAVYGCRTLGKIWGLATLIVMGVGPFAGSFIGGLLRDLSGSYTPAIYYALGSFGASVLLAATLPTAVRPED